MPRKKSAASEAAKVESNTSTTAVAEPPAEKAPLAPLSRPAWIDGPPVNEEGANIDRPEQPKNWGNPYKAVLTGNGFELGENRRFNQRVFTFREKPSDEVLAALKENGFTYRASEKAWTIQANAETRRLSDELASEFLGKSQGLGR